APPRPASGGRPPPTRALAPRAAGPGGFRAPPARSGAGGRGGAGRSFGPPPWRTEQRASRPAPAGRSERPSAQGFQGPRLDDYGGRRRSLGRAGESPAAGAAGKDAGAACPELAAGRRGDVRGRGAGGERGAAGDAVAAKCQTEWRSDNPFFFKGLWTVHNLVFRDGTLTLRQWTAERPHDCQDYRADPGRPRCGSET